MWLARWSWRSRLRVRQQRRERSTSDISKLLNDFLDSLQNSTNQASGCDDTGANASANPSLLFDYQS